MPQCKRRGALASHIMLLRSPRAINTREYYILLAPPVVLVGNRSTPASCLEQCTEGLAQLPSFCRDRGGIRKVSFKHRTARVNNTPRSGSRGLLSPALDVCWAAVPELADAVQRPPATAAGRPTAATPVLRTWPAPAKAPSHAASILINRQGGLLFSGRILCPNRL